MDEGLEKYKGAAALLLLAVIGAGIIVLLFRQFRSDDGIEILLPTVTPARVALIKVDVRGAVASPAVYELREGDRVDDAIKKAGGLLPEADLNAVNLAARLRDGEQLRIPKVGEAASPPLASTEPGKIDINSAPQAVLETLPRIGEVTAKRIIDHRLKNGPFNAIEELRDLKLVSASVFEQIKDQIAVGR